MPSLDTIFSFLITALASIFVFGTVIFIHELGHFLAAKFSGIKVNEFALGMGPTIFSITRKETKYALRLFPIGGFVSMDGEDNESEEAGSFTKAPVSNRILVTIAGAVMNVALGFIVLLVVVISQKTIVSRTVAEFITPDASTAKSGLMVNDEIIAVNSRRCFIANDISYEFARTQQGTADLTVLRDGKKVELKNVVFSTVEGTDATAGLPQLVIDFRVFSVEKTVFNVLREAGNWTISLARLVLLSFVDLVSGRVAINNLSGPVGIVTAIGQASAMGFLSVLMLLALITINLGVFNLLPLPALDGGRLVFYIIEAIRRKPINHKYEMAVNAIGFTVLMAFMLFVTFNDITKLLR